MHSMIAPAAAGEPSKSWEAVGRAYEGMVGRAALAHIVAGFAQRRPSLVRVGELLLDAAAVRLWLLSCTLRAMASCMGTAVAGPRYMLLTLHREHEGPAHQLWYDARRERWLQ
jgi:hypothetical protein